MVGQANEALSQPTHLSRTIGRLVAVHIHNMDYPVVAESFIPWYLVYACSKLVLVQSGTPDPADWPELFTMREMLDNRRQ